MKSDLSDAGELHVYECRGTAYPGNEPSCEGFLGIWPEPPYYYLFFEKRVPSEVDQWIQNLDGWALTGTYRLNYDQWQQISSERHRVGPFVVGTSLSGPDETTSPGDVLIELNPGVVFGSGLHPTTQGCLLAIADVFKRFPIEEVVDLGTGTGILALACALLGASKVMALDCNPLAVQVARRNAERNKVDKTVHMLVAEELDVLRRPCDLLIMNLEWPCLKKVLQGDDWLRYPRVILSGFLEPQWDELKSLLPGDISVCHRRNLEDWMTVVVESSDSGRTPATTPGRCERCESVQDV